MSAFLNIPHFKHTFSFISYSFDNLSSTFFFLGRKTFFEHLKIMKYNKNDKFMNKHNNNKNIIETQLSSKQVKSSFNSIFSGLLFKSIDKRELIFISFITKKI